MLILSLSALQEKFRFFFHYGRFHILISIFLLAFISSFHVNFNAD